MQEIRYDGSEALTDAATLEQFEKAMADDRNQTVALHKPGAVFKSKGRKFVVTDEGKIRAVRRAKRKRQKASRRKNR